MQTLEKQQLDTEPTVRATGDIILAEGLELSVFEISPPEIITKMRRNNEVAVDNVEGFDRLVAQGIDGLKDGETINFAGFAGKGILPSEIRTVSRTGDSFSIISSDAYSAEQPYQLVKSETSPHDQASIKASSRQVNKFFDGLETNPVYLNYMGDLIERGDELGEVAKALGYTLDGSSYPVPSALRNNILRIRKEGGVAIPKIQIFETGSIPGEDYVGSWAKGEFPVSGELGWYGHDAAQDHMQGLFVFGQEAMDFAQLYAQSVQSSDTMTGLKYPNQYEINKPEPQKIEINLSGQEKIDHGAYCLDQFTSELASMVSNLDIEPLDEGVLIVPQHLDYLGEMARVILDSPEHRDQFMGILESNGSKALENGEFSYDVFAREMLARAQKQWGITPKPIQKLVSASRIRD